MICALCLKEKETLINSHLIPAAAYAHVRGGTEAKNKSPVQINLHKKSAFHTDKQVQQPLLCSCCEDLFSRNGEKHAGKLWATRRGFPLLKLLESKALVVRGERFTTYDTRALDPAVVNSIFYLAVSVFWRASVWKWEGGGNGYSGALEGHEAEFRSFLLGEKELKNVLLFVNLNSNPHATAMLSFPSSGFNGEERYHVFNLLGMRFNMYVGSSISAVTRTPFDLLGVNTIFVSSDGLRSPAFEKLARRVQTNVVARGSLNNKARN
ncbi:hypothetical protein M5G25_30935 [Pseudomonas sp. TNT2022 ID357]|uniref:HNH endonuclease n=1 Tax=Pseudomonas idahonensis TaxID=2942628 RepID=A0ABT5QEP1_9PSED|nr:hypothetical protein [Pseudomonas idahonensis]MDD1152688.1 hypothetical protein [Pseudomonas idahonensis]